MNAAYTQVMILQLTPLAERLPIQNPTPSAIVASQLPDLELPPPG